jgi:hypothetical protein
MSPLANYSSEVSPKKSFQNIVDMLVDHDAEQVMGEYKDGEPVGIFFLIQTPQGKLPFHLPARIANVEVILRKRRKNYDRLWGEGKKLADECDRKQAKITAWKNLHDWTRAQLALIEIDMVTLDQVFLPYLQYKGRTVYQIFTEGNLLTTGNQDGEFHEV